MSEQPDETGQPAETDQPADGATTPGIDDADLPEDLRPGEDNPLAEPLEPGETPEVDLNQPSGSYEREREESGEDDEGDESPDQADDGASDDD